MMKLILLFLVIYLIFKWNKMTFTYKCLTIALCIILIKIDKTDKKIFANPGSISRPRNGSEHSYLIIDENKIVLKNLEGKILVEEEI